MVFNRQDLAEYIPGVQLKEDPVPNQGGSIMSAYEAVRNYALGKQTGTIPKPIRQYLLETNNGQKILQDVKEAGSDSDLARYVGLRIRAVSDLKGGYSNGFDFKAVESRHMGTIGSLEFMLYQINKQEEK